MTDKSRFGPRLWSVMAGLIGFAMLALYITVIIVQGSTSIFNVLPWVVVMAFAALGAIGSAMINDRRSAKRLMIGSAVGSTLLGVVSILTIGLGFLVAAAVGWVAAAQLSRSDPPGQR